MPVGQSDCATEEDKLVARNDRYHVDPLPDSMEIFDTIIIGAGAAGLSMGYRLHYELPSKTKLQKECVTSHSRHSLCKYLIIEKNNCAASAWDDRYDRLHLHTIKKVSQLPGLAMPLHYPEYVSRQQFSDYLKGYALIHQLNILYNYKVIKTTFNEDKKLWQIDMIPNSSISDGININSINTSTGGNVKVLTIFSRVLINCCGPETIAEYPNIKNMELYKRGKMIHTADYRNPTSLFDINGISINTNTNINININDEMKEKEDGDSGDSGDVGINVIRDKIRGKKVLIVGCGNSGCELAVDCYEYGLKPSIIIRSEIAALPRKIGRLIQYSASDIAHKLPLFLLDISSRILQNLSYYDLPRKHNIKLQQTPGIMTSLRTNNQAPLVDIGFMDLVRQGKIEVISNEIEEFTQNGIIYEDKDKDNTRIGAEFDAVLLATGYKKSGTFGEYFGENMTQRLCNLENGMIKSGSGYECNDVYKESGLYFIGFSDLIGRIFEQNIETKRVAKDLVSKGYV